MDTLVKRIKELCALHKITINELEQKVSLTPSSIYKWDKSLPSIDKVRRVADFLNVSVDYLLGRSSIKQTAKQLSTDEDILYLQRLKDFLPPDESARMMQFLQTYYGGRHGT